MGPERHPPMLLLAGPTAVGKSEVALLLAEHLDAEIISVDSMQVYRGMDIGTAKPTSAERARVPHHLLDVAAINEPFDAARFVALAEEAIAQVRARRRLPVLCGGTGLYFKALLQGLGQAPPADPQLRRQLRATPLTELLRELAEKDPAAYERIDRANPRRVIRAVEVIRLTGQAFSAQRVEWETPLVLPQGTAFFGLTRHPDDLRRRIDERVDAMFRLGLVDETRALQAQGLSDNLNAMQALGYRQVVEYLAGVRPLAETVELVKARTRKFAKRQMTWFRRQLPVRWIEVAPEQPAGAVADQVEADFRAAI